MNIANILTLSRIVLAAVIVWLLLLNSLNANIMATVLFIVAALTDFYDGHLAKKQGLISDFGKIMDPIADKVLLLSMFWVFAVLGMIEGWMVVVIAVREIGVTADRLWMMQRGQVLAAEKAGKIKTVCQITAVSVILLYLIVDQSAWAMNWFYQIQQAWHGVINALMFATLCVTIYSGVAYVKSRWNLN